MLAKKNWDPLERKPSTLSKRLLGYKSTAGLPWFFLFMKVLVVFCSIHPNSWRHNFCSCVKLLWVSGIFECPLPDQGVRVASTCLPHWRQGPLCAWWHWWWKMDSWWVGMCEETFEWWRVRKEKQAMALQHLVVRSYPRRWWWDEPFWSSQLSPNCICCAVWLEHHQDFLCFEWHWCHCTQSPMLGGRSGLWSDARPAFGKGIFSPWLWRAPQWCVNHFNL